MEPHVVAAIAGSAFTAGAAAGNQFRQGRQRGLSARDAVAEAVLPALVACVAPGILVAFIAAVVVSLIAEIA